MYLKAEEEDEEIAREKRKIDCKIVEASQPDGFRQQSAKLRRGKNIHFPKQKRDLPATQYIEH